MPRLLYTAVWLLLISCVKNKTTELPQIDPPPSASDRYVHVSTAAQLTSALLDAKPGDEIIMADGVYQGKFVISATVSGTAAKPVILRGSRNVILDAGSITTGYVLYLQANYWRIKGFTITNGLKGLMTDGASYNTIDSLFVHDIGEEAIHLRKFSSHNIIQNTVISNTGLKTPDYGEGIYIGSAKNNWATYTNGVEDRCDSNTVLKNKIGPNISAECIDIKEGTTGGLIKENYFDAVKKDFELLEKTLNHDKKQDLIKNKREIMQLLQGEIVTRYYFQKGRLQNQLKEDDEVREAINILADQSKYENILKGK